MAITTPVELNEALAAGGNGVPIKVPDIAITSGAHTRIILPSSDPHVLGALWNNSGTVTVSGG